MSCDRISVVSGRATRPGVAVPALAGTFAVLDVSGEDADPDGAGRGVFEGEGPGVRERPGAFEGDEGTPGGAEEGTDQDPGDQFSGLRGGIRERHEPHRPQDPRS